MAYFVYILRSLRNGSFYKGHTENIERRLMEHNSGKESSTSRYMPWELAWFCEKGTRSEAVSLEKKLKNITSKIKIESFIERNSVVVIENADVA